MMYEAPSMMYAYSCLDSVLCGSLHAGIVLALWNLTLFDPDFGLFYFIHFSHFILFSFFLGISLCPWKAWLSIRSRWVLNHEF
jgi:hypothetical protein